MYSRKTVKATVSHMPKLSNAAACVEMRRLVSVVNPGIVSLNDQDHVVKLLVGHLCKVSRIPGRVSTATAVPAFVRRHRRLLAAYEAAKFRYNKFVPEDAASKKQTAVSYILEMNNGAELPRLVKP